MKVVIFHSYVSLPEGMIWHFCHLRLRIHPWTQKPADFLFCPDALVDVTSFRADIPAIPAIPPGIKLFWLVVEPNVEQFEHFLAIQWIQSRHSSMSKKTAAHPHSPVTLKVTHRNQWLCKSSSIGWSITQFPETREFLQCSNPTCLSFIRRLVENGTPRSWIVIIHWYYMGLLITYNHNHQPTEVLNTAHSCCWYPQTVSGFCSLPHSHHWNHPGNEFHWVSIFFGLTIVVIIAISDLSLT